VRRAGFENGEGRGVDRDPGLLEEARQVPCRGERMSVDLERVPDRDRIAGRKP